MKTLLAIETSCDDTSAAILRGRTLLADSTHMQVRHQYFGGVVPELASRDHLEMIDKVVDIVVQASGLELRKIDAIAYTAYPGLMGSLLVGKCFAQGLSLALNIPLIPVDHLMGHVLSILIDNDLQPLFPFICLTASGGHTQLVLVESFSNMKVLGETLDDAVGEAFDKIGKILNLPYPAGKEIDRLAALGDETSFMFPITRVQDYNYSFSGIKSSFKNFIDKNIKKDSEFVENNLNDICASIQANLINALISKFDEAIMHYNPKAIAIAGGVAANSRFRIEAQKLAARHKISCYSPEKKFCTDNAAMIGIVAQCIT